MNQNNHQFKNKRGNELLKDAMNESSVLFEKLVTLDELLVLLRNQYSKRSIYRWCKQDGMPHKRIRGRLWFPVSEVALWFERS